MSTHLHRIEAQLKQEFPSLHTSLEPPPYPSGVYWLDLDLDGHSVTVEWQEGRGFGVSASLLTPILGEKPEETYESFPAALSRIRELLRNRAHTTPPPAVMLAELRERMGIQQSQLAEAMGVTQASISKLERREDMHVRSLARYVLALGAVLEINVRFPKTNELFRVCQFEDATQLSPQAR